MLNVLASIFFQPRSRFRRTPTEDQNPPAVHADDQFPSRTGGLKSDTSESAEEWLKPVRTQIQILI
jgi:hypothetical protein